MTVVAFTSCMDAERCPDQPVWTQIAEQLPDALLLLGDQIYMDPGLSIGRKPRWARVVERRGGLALFQAEMHARYRAQWQVPQFRALMIRMREGNKPVIVTRDDHDFAWNNAYGAGKDEHAVSEEVARVSTALFNQFAAAINNPDSPYPAAAAAAASAAQNVPAQIASVPFLLLDVRSQRTHRDEDGVPTLLGNQTPALLNAVAAQRGLLIVAGGSPMRHPYLLGNQGWWAPADNRWPDRADRAYPEYRAFVDAAKLEARPVLYLAGDVHSNAYGGPVETDAATGQPSSIVQVLSSGAALGKLLFKRFPASFALLDVQSADLSNGSVTVKLFADGVAETPVLLTLQGGHWVAVPQGTCAEADRAGFRFADAQLDAPAGVDGPAALSLLCYRERGREWLLRDEFDCHAEELDELVFEDALPVSGTVAPKKDFDHYRDWPEPVRVSAVSQGRLHISRYRGGDDQVSKVRGLIEETFRTARRMNKHSVVFFVHGFNKSFAASVDQASELRARFPGCEPLLYSWPSGGDGGLLKLLGGFGAARAHSIVGAKGLASALADFGRVASSFVDTGQGDGIKAVVLARSMGAQALASVMDAHLGPAVAHDLKTITRIVLSAPACKLRRHAEWLARFGGEVVVTINRNDRKLDAADWLDWGDLLGNTMPAAGERAANAGYVDCTQVSAVLGNHDYLFRTLGSPFDEFNAGLLHGVPIPALPKVPGMVVAP